MVLRVTSAALDATASAIGPTDWLPSNSMSLLEQTASIGCLENVTLTLVTTILGNHNASGVLGAPSAGSYLGDSANSTTWSRPLIPLSVSLYLSRGAIRPLLCLKSFMVVFGCLGIIWGLI